MEDVDSFESGSNFSVAESKVFYSLFSHLHKCAITSIGCTDEGVSRAVVVEEYFVYL